MGYIFESEIEAIMHSIRARTIGESESITLRQVLESDIHPGIKAYFRAEVEKLLQKEREKEVRSKKFPYALPEVMRLQEQIDLLLKHYYEFDQKDFQALLDEAVHFQFNYLCRPQFTLMNFLFENRRRVPVTEIERKLNYCVEYTYYREIIRRYIVDRGLAKMTYEEFQSLLDHIDREVVSRHTSWELARMLTALHRFVDAGLSTAHKPDGQPTLPINAVIVFFEDKKLLDIKTRLEHERDQHNVQEISIQELAHVIEKVRTANEDAVAEIDERPRRPSRLRRKAAAAEPAPESTRESAPKEPRLRVVEQEQELFQPATTPARGDGQPLPAPADQSVGETSVQNEMPRQREEKPEEGIHTIFTRSEQKQFVKKIFRKDEIAFREALDTLNLITSWEEATHYLDRLFVANDVNPFSEEAIEFTDKVYAWFHPREQQTG
jgi:hypothetical protein